MDNGNIFWIIGIFAISGGVIVLLIRSKKIRKIFLPVFIGFIAAGSLLATTATKASAGEDLTGKIAKSTPIKVDKKDLTINGLVTYDEWVVMPGKGDLVTLDGQNDQFRVLKTNGSQAEVLAMNGEKIRYNIDSTLDNYLNGNTEGCYYYGLSDNIKNAIIPQNITQYNYNWHSEQTKSEMGNNNIKKD